MARSAATTATADRARRPAGALTPPPQGSAWREAAIVLLVFAVAAVAVTWPFVTHLQTTAHDPYDPLFASWNIDWVQHAFSGHGSLYDTNIFTPQTLTLVYSDTLIGTALLLLPFRWMGMSPVGVTNAGVLVGFTLSGAAAYAFGRVVSGSRGVGLVTGAAYSFGPFGTAQGGHIQTVMRPGVPLAALGVWLMAERLERDRSPWPPFALVVGAIAWQSSSSIYFGVYGLIAAVVVAAVRVTTFRRRWWPPVLAVGAAALCLLAWLIPYLIVRNRFPGLGDFQTEAGLHLLRTDPRLSIWGPWLGFGSGWPVLAAAGFPGATLLLLTPIGAVLSWRRGARRLVTLALALIGTGLVLAVTGRHGVYAYLPSRVLYQYVPGLRALRSTNRAWTIGLMGVGILSGSAVHELARIARPHLSRASWRRAVAPVFAALAFAGVLVEGYAPWTHLPRVAIAPVDRALGRRRDPGGVLYLPVNGTGTNVGDLSAFLQPADIYGTTAHHRKTPNGYSGFFPPSYFEMSRLMLDLPAPPSIEYLRRIGVRYVVLRGLTGGRWGNLAHPDAGGPLRVVGRFGRDVLLEVLPGPNGR